MAGAAQVFADEAGHSGANYIDPGQPIFVTAALVVPNDVAPQVEDEIAQYRAHHQPSRGVALEVKFGRVVATARLRDGVAELLERLMDLGCDAVVDVWEKRFGIATRIVDSLCDSDFNALAGGVLPPMDPRRVKIAYFLDKHLSDDALHAFARAFRAAHRAEMRAAQQRIVGLTRLAGRDDLAYLFDQCDVDALIANCTHEDRHHRTLNFPSFLSLLGRIDTALERMERTGPLFFDQQEEFRAPFEDAHTMLEVGRAVDFVVEQSTFRVGFSRITSYEMGSSTDLPGLQGADALAAVVRSGLSNLHAMGAASSTSRFMRRLFGVPAPDSGARFGVLANLSAGEALLKRFGEAMYAVL